jgi:octaprenyl-diphosphate synthase
MSTLKRIQSQIAPELKQLNDLIAQTLSSPNELMNRVVDNYLRTKGKQIRPIIVILSAKLIGHVDNRVISAAAAVELLHNASLIHDDVVDETKTRRGEATINGLWDNHIAVLIGDFFVSSSLQRALDTADLRIIESIAKLGKLLSIGEIDQIYNARYHNLNEEAYLQAIYRKTASLFVSCVEMGAYATGIDDDRLPVLRNFAHQLGLCFQIKDDIFDYLGDDKIGKPTGNDLREGKITLPLLYALTHSSSPLNSSMIELSRKDNLSSDEISALINYAKDNGGIEYAYNRMQQMRDDAVASLSTAFPANEIANDLIDLFDFTISRQK